METWENRYIAPYSSKKEGFLRFTQRLICLSNFHANVKYVKHALQMLNFAQKGAKLSQTCTKQCNFRSPNQGALNASACFHRFSYIIFNLLYPQWCKIESSQCGRLQSSHV